MRWERKVASMPQARRFPEQDFGIPFWNGKPLNLVELEQLEFGLRSHWRGFGGKKGLGGLDVAFQLRDFFPQRAKIALDLDAVPKVIRLLIFFRRCGSSLGSQQL